MGHCTHTFFEQLLRRKSLGVTTETVMTVMVPLRYIILEMLEGAVASERCNVSLDRGLCYQPTERSDSFLMSNSTLFQEIELVFKPHPKDHDPETICKQTRYIKTTAIATGKTDRFCSNSLLISKICYIRK